MENISGTLTICLPYAALEPIFPKLKTEFQSEKMEVDHVWVSRLAQWQHKEDKWSKSQKYFPFQSINELGNDVVVITIGTARPDRDEGEVGYRQTLWLERTMKKYEDKTTILAMHHHLIGIPDTGSDRLTIVDAGDVLRATLNSKVNLVLCGHKHRPWMWDFNNLLIANAGTASSKRVRGFFENSYNIVDITNGKIRVDLKVVEGKRTPLKDISQNYVRFEDE
jgi:3',5'-cyclic AMP phosphodiesterase CpdA